MEIVKVLLTNYLPYAKGVIIGRAIPQIDGLKPVQRRLLYTMYKMGLLNGDKTKSANIAGQTMRLHPHGDGAIYETMVRMTTGNESLNIPYVESKGNFGKVYSKSMAYAASRYTEAKLAPICAEIFDGIDEEAVDFIDNYDSTMKEPTLLPVKFPSILVNPSNGIAVGTSSNIPSFGLKAVCDATIGVLNGTIKNPAELMQVLGTPEFTTGGVVHASDADLTSLGETGYGSFTVSGVVTTYPTKILITEIPYKTYAESIISQVEQYVKSGELKEIADINDQTDLDGFKILIELKRNSVPSVVLQKLCRLTDLRMKMAFRTRVIINDRCEDKGIYELLNDWIKFRTQTIARIYQHRVNKKTKQEHLLSVWDKIGEDVKKISAIITGNDEPTAKSILMSSYGLDNEQAEYVLDIKNRQLTKDNVNKKLKELATLRDELTHCKKILASDQEKFKIMIEDLERIGKKYGTKPRTHRAEPVIETANDLEEAKKIDDTVVSVVLTKSGLIKRLISLRDESNFVEPEDDPVVNKWAVRNCDHILVFTCNGEVHKILVDSIDASRGGMKEKISNIIMVEDNQIIFVDAAKDYKDYFNIVYPNGRGTRVLYSRASGNRSKYKGLFEEVKPGCGFITKSDKFFMITAKRKASYMDLTMLGQLSNRIAFKVARVSSGDRIIGLQPVEKVPDMSTIDISKYNKPYCINIGKDVLWAGAEDSTETDKHVE